jgi:general secretion pathway protein G
MNSRVSRPVFHFAVATVVVNLLLWGVGGAYQFLSARRVKVDEATLDEDLRMIRRSIDQFAADLERSPQSLDELVSERYIDEVPIDPMTGSSATWVLVFEADSLWVGGQPGLIDVKSGSTRVEGAGQRRYSDW